MNTMKLEEYLKQSEEYIKKLSMSAKVERFKSKLLDINLDKDTEDQIIKIFKEVI